MKTPFPKTNHFAFVAIHLNSLLDKGQSEAFDDMAKWIDERNVLHVLYKKYDLDFDMSLFAPESEISISLHRFFSEMNDATVARRKFGVVNNGLCLLLAICLEGAQKADPTGMTYKQVIEMWDKG